VTRKAHILILVENLPVPFDRRVWMEATTLTEAGYKVSVISPQPPDDDQFDRVIDGVHVYRYPDPSGGKGKLAFVREFWQAYWQTRQLAKRIWLEDPFDCIHSCNPPDIFWHIARLYKPYGVRFVFDQHDLCPELYLSKYGRRDPFYYALHLMEKLQYRTSDAVIATNESYRRTAMTRGKMPEELVTVVRSGPLIERFNRVAPDPALRRGKKHLAVYLGVMGSQDGVDYALRAVRHAVDAGLDDAAFTFIGHGDETEKLTAMSQAMGLNGSVHFTGRIPDEELKRHLSTADLGIAPDPRNALNNVSTMNKIIEYMAMSLPIVSFDLEETRFSAGEAAVYIGNDDERAMGLAIKDLIAQPELRARMGRIGRQRFERELSWDRSRRVLVRFYDHLLNRRSALTPAPVPPVGVPTVGIPLGKLGLWPEDAEVPVVGLAPGAGAAERRNAAANRAAANAAAAARSSLALDQQIDLDLDDSAHVQSS
jgi:glycosyltransferase involved in cell wall biosynthesis